LLIVSLATDWVAYSLPAQQVDLTLCFKHQVTYSIFFLMHLIKSHVIINHILQSNIISCYTAYTRMFEKAYVLCQQKCTQNTVAFFSEALLIRKAQPIRVNYRLFTINKKFWEEPIAYFPFIRHRPHRKSHLQQFIVAAGTSSPRCYLATKVGYTDA
jgi:hypothetical protein